ncbi:hemerythrin domain-containing protein [Vibrio sp. FNV 38]|nr:hemerythrin domain-containing protein [Vibrio sp. FNV 38]
MMIERIRREHGYMIRLLAMLRRKLVALKEEQTINYSLVREIVDYLANHSNSIHHPKEDILYHYYTEHYGHNQGMENLEDEHIALSNKTHDFLDLIEMILADAVIPQDVFIAQLEDFLSMQRKHLEFEEQSILPLIANAFTPQDWQQVEALWDKEDIDPVFGDTIADEYVLLADRVRRGERECV